MDERIVIFEDLLVLWSVFLNAKKVVFQDIHLYHYTINSESALNQPFRTTDWQRRRACLKMLEIARISFKDAIPYVKKTFIMADLRIAEKMCVSGNLNSKHRKCLKKEIISLYTEDVDKLLTPDRRKRINTFLNRYYVFYFKQKTQAHLSKINRLVKNRMHWS